MASLVIAGCAAHGSSPNNDLTNRGACRDGMGESKRQAPIVCVDDSQRILSVNPEPVRAHNALKNDQTTGVQVQWFTKSGRGDLKVTVHGGCVGRMTCPPGQGHCFARVTPGHVGQCKYDVAITSGDYELLDPTLVVEACCSDD